MYCMNCGKQLPDYAVFCSGCGTAVKQDVKSTNQQHTTLNTTVRSLPESDFSQRVEQDIAKIDEYNRKANDFYSRREYDVSANQARQALEIMVKHLLWRCHTVSEPKPAEGIYMLAHAKYNSDTNIIDEESEKNYHFIRVIGNDGSHSGSTVSESQCKSALYLLNKEIKKFKNIYVKRNYADIFIKPIEQYSLVEQIVSRGVGVICIVFAISFMIASFKIESMYSNNDYMLIPILVFFGVF